MKGEVEARVGVGRRRRRRLDIVRALRGVMRTDTGPLIVHGVDRGAGVGAARHRGGSTSVGPAADHVVVTTATVDRRIVIAPPALAVAGTMRRRKQ